VFMFYERKGRVLFGISFVFFLSFLFSFYLVSAVTWSGGGGTSTILTVNSSDFWDNLDNPDDIIGSEFWYNFTIATYNLYNNIWSSIFNSTYDVKADYNFTTNDFNGSGNFTTTGWLNGLFNWFTGDNWNIFNGSTLSFNESKLSTVYYNLTQSEAVAGTIDGGTLVDTQHPNGDYDGITFNFSEESGSPALDLRINFTDIDSFNRGIIRYKTSLLSGIFPIIQLWSYESNSWEDYPIFSESLSFATITQPVFDDANHIKDGIVQMRLYKASNGNINNNYYIDWVAISKGFGTPSGQEVDPFFEQWLNEPIFTNNINATGINITAREYCNETNCYEINDFISTTAGTYNATYSGYSNETYNATYSGYSNETYNATYDSLTGVFEEVGNVIVQKNPDYDEDFVFGSPQLADDGDTDHDARMWFDKSKGAFRSGKVTGAEWDDVNVGDNSAAFGYKTTASGVGSAAFGAEGYANCGSPVASGNYSFATGGSRYQYAQCQNAPIASGTGSVAMGIGTVASGDYSVAMGFGSTISSYLVANGFGSVAMGANTKGTGSYSVAMGQNTVSSGNSAVAMGNGNTASGDFSVAIGAYLKAEPYACVAFGKHNIDTGGTTGSWVATDPLFIIGKGTASYARSNALTILKNGKTGIGTITPTQILDVIGNANISGTIYSETIKLEDDSKIYMGSADDVSINMNTTSFNIINEVGSIPLYFIGFSNLIIDSLVTIKDSLIVEGGLNVTGNINSSGLICDSNGCIGGSSFNANGLDDESLVYFWGFDERSCCDNIWEEVTGVQGSFTGAPVTVRSQFGRGLDYDNDYITMVSDYDDVFLGGAWTLSLWIKPETQTAAWHSVMGSGGWQNNGSEIALDEDGDRIKFGWGNSTEFETQFSIWEDIIIGEWNFVTYRETDDIVSTYINGEWVSETDVSSYTYRPATGSNTWRIGNAYGNGFEGVLDELRMYNRSLTDKEVQALYLGLAPRETVHLA